MYSFAVTFCQGNMNNVREMSGNFEEACCYEPCWCLCGSMSQWHSWFPRAMLIIFGWYRWAGTKWVKEPFMTCPNIAPSVNDPVDFYIYATHWKCLTVNIAMTSCRNLEPGVNAVLGCSYLLCPIVSHIWRIRRAFQKRLWNLNILSTHIPFIPCWSALPVMRCSYLKIWPWKSKVKVMGEVKV